MSSSGSALESPGLPSEAVGPRRPIIAWLSLPPLGWLFVAAAVFVAALRLQGITGESAAMLPDTICAAVGAALVALLPAALLIRLPESPRTQRLLFAGLALGAASEWAWATTFIWAIGPGVVEWLGTLLFALWWPLGGLGSLLLGLGLLRLRARRTRTGLLIGIGALYVALSLFTIGIVVAQVPQAYDLSVPNGFVTASGFALAVLVAVVGAFVVWVPVSAWLDHDAPRAFWGLLALAFPLSLVARAGGLIQTIAMQAFASEDLYSNGFFVVATTLSALVAAVVALLALVAYARETPLPEDAAEPS
ncbi:MAG: hypothetical protein ACLQHS_05245 [Candidatus Limnocylindrales bacterium]